MVGGLDIPVVVDIVAHQQIDYFFSSLKTTTKTSSVSSTPGCMLGTVLASSSLLVMLSMNLLMHLGNPF